MFHDAISALTTRLTNSNTRAAYIRAALEFEKWCIDQRLDEPEQITRVVLNAYAQEIALRLGASAVKQRIATVRALLKHIGISELAREPLIAPRPRAGNRRPAKDGVEQLLAHVFRRCVNTRLELRDRALIHFLASVPFEVSSAVKLKTGEVIEALFGLDEVIAYGPFRIKDFLVVDGHSLPIEADLQLSLKQYIEAAGLAVEEDGWLFRAMRRQTDLVAATALSRIDVWRILSRYSIEAGLGSCVTARDLMYWAKKRG